MLVIFMFLICYLALGALVNTFLIRISFVDSLYFSVVSIETIGFGDITPNSTGARVLMCIYGPLGIVLLAVFVTMTRATLLEAMEIGYRQRLIATRERRQEVARRRRVKSRWRDEVGWRLKNLGVPVWVKDGKQRGCFESLLYWIEVVAKKWLGWSLRLVKKKDGHRHHQHGMRLNLEALSPQQLEAAAAKVGVPLSELLSPNFKMTKAGTRKGGGRENILTCTDGGRTIGESNAEKPVNVEPNSGFPRAVGLGSRTSTITVNPRSNELNSDGRKNSRGLVGAYHNYKNNMDQEERRASYVRLAIALSLFFVFWIVRPSLIFVGKAFTQYP
jgi:potassium channel subfamily K